MSFICFLLQQSEWFGYLQTYKALSNIARWFYL